MTARIVRPDTAFDSPTQRRPRQKRNAHLDFIRSLPCLVCHAPPRSQAAHIRMADYRAGKRETGKGEKPSDEFTVPLCDACHRDQHSVAERDFWLGVGISDVIRAALALWAATGDESRALMIIRGIR